MDDLNISLPASQQSFVEDQVPSGHYPSVSDDVAVPVRADQKAKAQEKLETLLLEGSESEEIEWTDENWDALRRRASGH